MVSIKGFTKSKTNFLRSAFIIVLTFFISFKLVIRAMNIPRTCAQQCMTSYTRMAQYEGKRASTGVPATQFIKYFFYLKACDWAHGAIQIRDTSQSPTQKVNSIEKI